MRKNFGAKAWTYPQPVYMIASYDENGVADVMNAAWGCIAGYKQIALYLDVKHQTTENILKRKAFSVSMGDASCVEACDYVGIVSAKKEPQKVEKAGFHVVKSNFVDAPLIEELPMAVECQLLSYDKESELIVGEIINVSVDERILDSDGNIDLSLFSPITFDPVHNDYITLGKKVGNAFKDGMKLKK